MKMINKLTLTILIAVNTLYAQNIELSATVISDNEKYIFKKYIGY
jgi:hypothetical protein